MAGNPPLVIDTSVAAKWFFPEPQSRAADVVLDDCTAGKVALAAPDLIVYEFTNLLWKRAGRGEIDSGEAGGLMDQFTQLPISLAPPDVLAERALMVALEAGCTAYDGAFIALAEELNSFMLTADRKLYEAVASTPLKKRIRRLA
jgi:predicted nucleic acid-binding protein